MGIDPLELLVACPLPEPAEIRLFQDRYILCLGGVMPATERTVLHQSCENPKKPTGTKGFMSFTVGDAYAPRTFVIKMIGVEIGSQNNGYSSLMLDWGESAAKAMGLEGMEVRAVINPDTSRLPGMLARRGYAEDEEMPGLWYKQL